jgi:hypothetical protein
VVSATPIVIQLEIANIVEDFAVDYIAAGHHKLSQLSPNVIIAVEMSDGLRTEGDYGSALAC